MLMRIDASRRCARSLLRRRATRMLSLSVGGFQPGCGEVAAAVVTTDVAAVTGDAGGLVAVGLETLDARMCR